VVGVRRVERFDLVVIAVLFVTGAVTLYPVINVFSISLSHPNEVARGITWLPRHLDLSAYEFILDHPMIGVGYRNSLIYVTIGTTINLVMTCLCAYPLSKKGLVGRKFVMLLIVFTMFFSGGLIPLFVLVVKLGLYGTRWAIVIPTLIATFNLIICRTFFQTLPEDLFESARIEGAGEWRIVWKIVLPLSKPIVAVLVLFYGIAHWNSFFPALLYLPKADLQPIQIYLRRVLIQASPEAVQQFETGEAGEGIMAMVQIKFAVMIVAMLPILLLYPFLQKYFVKGVLIGALKG
jgi:putative aldouronate transport system permease protein